MTLDINTLVTGKEVKLEEMLLARDRRQESRPFSMAYASVNPNAGHGTFPLYTPAPFGSTQASGNSGL